MNAHKILNESVRTYLCDLRRLRPPSPRGTLAEATLHLFLCKIQPTVSIRIANPSRGVRQLGWATCLSSSAAGWVTLGKRDSVSSYKCFGSPDQDNSRRGEYHIMPIFRI